MNPWDRQPGEPTVWFSRFEVYRLAGPGRTLEAIYQQEGRKGQKRAVHITGAWRSAVDAYHWRERAEAWDMFQIAQRREADEATYRRQLEQHRDNALKLGQVSLNNAVYVLKLLSTRLEAMTKNNEEIPQKLIPGFLRAAAYVAETALNGEAQALAVDELLRGLNDQHSD